MLAFQELDLMIIFSIEELSWAAFEIKESISTNLVLTILSSLKDLFCLLSLSNADKYSLDSSVFIAIGDMDRSEDNLKLLST